MLELHCHTTFSDGTLTPTQLIQEAVKRDVKVLAITDHDTLAGWEEAFRAAQFVDLEIVPGVELSTVWEGRSLHILGFYPDPQFLCGPLKLRLEGRKRRACEIAAKLRVLGYPIELPDMGESIAPGRPHIAAALVKAGHVFSSREAFDRFLGEDRPAYVHYEKFSALEGIALLRSCGAVSVWAHPYLFRGGKVEAVLPQLVAGGLQGLEVFHPDHTLAQQKRLQELCDNFGLLMTGGSDYHGPPANEEKARATVLNQFHLPLSLLEKLKQAAQSLALQK